MKALLLASAVFLSFGTAQAAESVAQLSKLTGKVMVNVGQGFEPAEPRLVLHVGDRVFVGQDSTAELSYAKAGCKVVLSSGSVISITDQAPCLAGSDVAMVDGVFIQPTFGSGNSELSTLYFVLPTLAIVAGVAVLAANYKSPTTLSLN